MMVSDTDLAVELLREPSRKEATHRHLRRLVLQLLLRLVPDPHHRDRPATLTPVPTRRFWVYRRRRLTSLSELSRSFCSQSSLSLLYEAKAEEERSTTRRSTTTKLVPDQAMRKEEDLPMMIDRLAPILILATTARRANLRTRH